MAEKVKEVILLGMGETGFSCPYDAEVWGVNRGYRKARRLDKLFMTDRRYEIDGETKKWLDVHWNCARRCLDDGVEIVSLHDFKEIKTKRYPYKAIVKRFRSEYFTDTICYMIAYALYKGYNHLRLYGIDMVTTKEYRLEKGGIEFWLGVATGMGCKVDISIGSAVCRTITGVPYGCKIPFDDSLKAAWKVLKKKKKAKHETNTN